MKKPKSLREVGRAVEAVDHAAHGIRAEDGERVVVGLARVDHRGEIPSPRLVKLLLEERQLRVAGVGGIVVVQANLAPRRQGAVRHGRTLPRGLVAVVSERAHYGRHIHRAIRHLRRERRRFVQRHRSPNGDYPLHAGRARANKRLAYRHRIRHVEMAMGVKQPHDALAG